MDNNCNDVVIRTTPPNGRTDTDTAVVSIIAPPTRILRSRLRIRTNVPTTPLLQAYRGRSFKERVCKHLLHCGVCAHRYCFDFRACILRIMGFRAQSKLAHYVKLTARGWTLHQACRQRYKH